MLNLKKPAKNNRTLNVAYTILPPQRDYNLELLNSNHVLASTRMHNLNVLVRETKKVEALRYFDLQIS